MSIQLETMPKLGFGLMRLPQKDGKIDIGQVSRMVDAYSTFYLDYGTEKAALNMLTMTMHNYFRNEPNLNIICVHPGWMRTNPGNTEAPLDPYEHAETLRLLFENKRHDKQGPVFITHTGEAYPW